MEFASLFEHYHDAVITRYADQLFLGPLGAKAQFTVAS